MTTPAKVLYNASTLATLNDSILDMEGNNEALDTFTTVYFKGALAHMLVSGITPGLDAKGKQKVWGPASLILALCNNDKNMIPSEVQKTLDANKTGSDIYARAKTRISGILSKLQKVEKAKPAEKVVVTVKEPTHDNNEAVIDELVVIKSALVRLMASRGADTLTMLSELGFAVMEPVSEVNIQELQLAAIS